MSELVARLPWTLGYALYALVSTIPLAILSTNGSTDPFLFQHVSSVVTLVRDPSIGLQNTFFQFQLGAGAIVTILVLVTGIQPQTILFLPIAGALYILLLPAFFRRLIPLPWALLASCTVAWSWLMPANYSIWPHTFGFLLYPAFVATYIEYAKRRTTSRAVVLVGFFVAIHFFSYTAELWVLAFTIATTLILMVARRRSAGMALPATFIALFIGFNEAVYHSFFPSVSAALASGRYIFTTDYFLSTVLGFPRVGGYAYTPPRIPLLSVLEWSRFLLYVLPLIAFLGIVAILLLRERLRWTELAKRASIETASCVAMIGVWAVNVIAYFLAGSTINAVLTGYLYFVGPFLSFFLLRKLVSRGRSVAHSPVTRPFRRPEGVHAISCLVISMVSFTLIFSFGAPTTSPSHYAGLNAPAQWLFTDAEGVPIVTDHYSMGVILLVAAESGRDFELYQNGLFYNASLYGRLVNSSQMEPQPSPLYLYVVNLEIADRATSGDNWNNYQPLSNYLQQIETNANVDRVYDSGLVLVFQG